MLASNFIKPDITVHLQSENGILGLVSRPQPSSLLSQLRSEMEEEEQLHRFDGLLICESDGFVGPSSPTFPPRCNYVLLQSQALAIVDLFFGVFQIPIISFTLLLRGPLLSCH